MIINRGIDKVNVGDFVNKVTFLQPLVSRNKRGAIERKWQDADTVYGKLSVMPAAETMIDQNVVNPDTVEFTTYVRDAITSEYRMRIEGQLYAITYVQRLLNQPLMVVKAEKITER